MGAQRGHNGVIKGTGGGGGAAPVLVCYTAIAPPSRVLRDSGVWAIPPTAPKSFCACFPFIHVLSATLAKQGAHQMSFVAK